MDQLSERHRIQILIIRGYGDRQRPHEEVCRIFNELYPERPPISRRTVGKTIQRFEETGNVKNKPKLGRPKSATTEEKQLDTLLAIVESPHVSTRQVARDLETSQTSVRRVLKKAKYHPYKIQLVQELSDDDFDRRSEFCGVMMDRCVIDRQFIFKICFSDEATFCLNGTLNRQNCRYWSDNNPHWMRESHTQHPQKVNVWCGIIKRHIVGPFFIDGSLNGDKYLALLNNDILPFLARLYPGNNGNIHESIWFQQDGAPPHYARNVRELLNDIFPGRWIGRRGPLEWPARSPDLTPLDFFLWGYLKTKVYKSKPNDLQDLKTRISEEIHDINTNKQHLLINSLHSFMDRLGHCVAAEGQQFEHLV